MYIKKNEKPKNIFGNLVGEEILLSNAEKNIFSVLRKERFIFPLVVILLSCPSTFQSEKERERELVYEKQRNI